MMAYQVGILVGTCQGVRRIVTTLAWLIYPRYPLCQAHAVTVSSLLLTLPPSIFPAGDDLLPTGY